MPRANNPDVYGQNTINFKRKLITPSLGALVGGALTGGLVAQTTPVASVGVGLVVSGAVMGALIANCFVSCMECIEGAKQIRQQAQQDSVNHSDTQRRVNQQAQQDSVKHSDTQRRVNQQAQQDSVKHSGTQKQPVLVTTQPLDDSIPATPNSSQQRSSQRRTANPSPFSDPLSQFLLDTHGDLIRQQAHQIASGDVRDPHLAEQIRLNSIMLNANIPGFEVNPNFQRPAE